MRRMTGSLAAVGACVLAGLAARSVGLANGGPFVLRYPKGDPAAKGVLARLAPDLRPARERRLRVVKEDLRIAFERDTRTAQWHAKTGIEPVPLVSVTAAYTIENPTGEEIAVDFGFPILRGIYRSPSSMTPRPDVRVDVDGKYHRATIISNSAIYGIIRQRARETIEKAIASDADLMGLVAELRATGGASREPHRRALAEHLAGRKGWSERDARLLVEYAGLDFDGDPKKPRVYPRDRSHWSWADMGDLQDRNLGALAAIGEQKATQLFARLASRFDVKATAAYEKIFTAWGGDVRERSVDLLTGSARPREVTVDLKALKKSPYAHRGDPTIYARVDYFNDKAKISAEEKAACRAVLKNLSVVFTFAPMNLLHYQVKFPANSKQVLTVRYRQYAYVDTKGPKSYQLAYVVHPASLWDEFGPINLEVTAPEGVGVRASVPCEYTGAEERALRTPMRYVAKGSKPRAPGTRVAVYRATLAKKTGELLVAVRADSWKRASGLALGRKSAQRARQQVQ
jgi:hypothetical protein